MKTISKVLKNKLAYAVLAGASVFAFGSFNEAQSDCEVISRKFDENMGICYGVGGPCLQFVGTCTQPID